MFLFLTRFESERAPDHNSDSNHDNNDARCFHEYSAVGV